MVAAGGAVTAWAQGAGQQKATAVRAAVTLSSTSLTFPAQPVGSVSPPQKVTLTNTGAAPLAINSVTASGDYRVSVNTCRGTTLAGKSCTMSVVFNPKAPAARQGTVLVHDNAPGSPQRIVLSGKGSDFSVSVGPGSASITPGQQTVYRLTVTPHYEFDRTVAMRCSGVPSGLSCAVSPSSMKLAGSGASTASVTVRATPRAGKGNFKLGLTATHGQRSKGTNVVVIVK
jgi:hypothetical protein